jgi:hypothetical protein
MLSRDRVVWACAALDIRMVVEWTEGDDVTFTVVYGPRRRDGLTHWEAARELGECILHSLARTGHLGGAG